MKNVDTTTVNIGWIFLISIKKKLLII